MPAAGKRSDAPLIGAVKFVMESGWSLGVQPPMTPAPPSRIPVRSTSPSSAPSTRLSSATGVLATSTTFKASYQPPPPGQSRRDAIRNEKSSFPQGTYPSDYRSLQQTDYLPGALQLTERVRPSTVRDSGKLLLKDVENSYATQHATDFGRLTPTNVKDSRARIPSGGVGGTQRAEYNIITGGSSLVNNNFEHWDTRDYRRHR
ncbi:MAG: hypothetical protein WDW38_007932 [Sanguina aurantia]